MTTISTSTTITNPSDYSWPITINGGTLATPTIIKFSSNLTLNTTSHYFIIGSEYVTIDGQNNTVTIDNVKGGYPGLVRNGLSNVNGFANITIQNINMSVTNGSKLVDSAGWICQSYFGKGVNSDSNIKNVHTDASCISSYDSGLICGAQANRVISTFCSSKGAILNYGGGIFGNYCTYCQATECFSTGQIGTTKAPAGGIFGANCYDTNIADKCYSTGNIKSYVPSSGYYYGSGGICSIYCTVQVTNCYSRGVINYASGGIFGYGSNSVTGIGVATNCYVYGTNNSGSNGVMGFIDNLGTINYNSSNVVQTNCYVANGNWDVSTAASILKDGPTYNEAGVLTKPVGDVWADISDSTNNTPWVFSTFGFSPYTTELTSTYSQTIANTGILSNPALSPTGHTYSIVSVNEGFANNYGVSINPNGSIKTTNYITPTGTLRIKVMQNSDYTITNFELTVLVNCYLETTKILCVVDGEEKYIKIKDIKINASHLRS